MPNGIYSFTGFNLMHVGRRWIHIRCALSDGNEDEWEGRQMNGAELVVAAHKSIREIEALSRREVTRIRMHPLDWEEIVGYYMPSKRAQAGEMARFLDRAIVLDESRRIGEPIAEFDE